MGNLNFAEAPVEKGRRFCCGVNRPKRVQLHFWKANSPDKMGLCFCRKSF